MNRQTWSEFTDAWKWKQGEHTTLLGPTGAGKTTLALEILPRRDHIVAFASKPKDPLLSDFRKQGFEVIREWPPPHMPPQRIILWPKIERHTDVVGQRMTFYKALADIYRQGGWTVYLDETRYITETLKLAALVDLLWLQGRSMGITVVASSQRPRSVPVTAFSEASHFFFWKSRDLYDVRRLREIGGWIDPDAVVDTLSTLGRHECLYLDARYGTMSVTQVEERRDHAARTRERA